MGEKIVQVDAFTDRPFARQSRRRSASCPARATSAWMQDVAREMNLSETAFLHPRGGRTSGSAGSRRRSRWTSAATRRSRRAHVLWEEGHVAPETPARFETRSGLLTARRDGDWIELDFPATARRARSRCRSTRCPGLGVPVRFAAVNRFDCLVEVESEEAVRSLAPDIRRLAALPVRGVIVTSRAATPGFDFVSRFFAPRLGIDEDPVCGSAHCCLGPYWAERLEKSDVVAYQASARGGVVRVRVRGPRVVLGGRAVTVLRGELVDEDRPDGANTT